jgi:glutamate-1-semialdehyde 2,1-aminomutase
MPESSTAGGVSRERTRAFYDRECARYARERPASKAAASRSDFYGGVPMHWMLDWPLPFPLVAKKAHGATLTDLDGIEYVDLCLGDTGSMFGHNPEPVVRAIREQAARGLAFMLSTEDAIACGRLLAERFGLPQWQIATTASDANRFALRVARAVTRRPKILVMNGCYHGAVDETYVALAGGRAINGPALIGQYSDLTQQTQVVEFNDLAALEAALLGRDVACVITEPVLTNCCMVLPEPGYHDGLRRLTRMYGTLLLIDETHTISSGPRGYTGAYGLRPDIFVLGKPIAGGVPTSAWGFTAEIAESWSRATREKPPGHSGLGTTLSANALSMAAMRAVLTEVMTDSAYAQMEALATRLADGLLQAVAAAGLPWHVARVGARVEFICAPGPLRNGTEARLAQAPELERAIHVGLVNRQCLIAPFHNMMLVCPATTRAQVDRMASAFAEITQALLT